MAKVYRMHAQRQQPQKFYGSVGVFVKEARTRLWLAAIKFGRDTSIPGLNRLLAEHMARYERCIWLFVFIACCWSYLYVSRELRKSFTGRNLETIIDTTRDPIYLVYFPSVTICNQNRLNWNRLEEARERFLPRASSPDMQRLFERVLTAYDDIRFAQFGVFETLRNESVAGLALLDGVNITAAFDWMSWRCEELITDCVWNFTPRNCCAIFTKRKSKLGIGWAFNTLVNDEGLRRQRMEEKYPWHLGDSKAGTGLSVRVHINPERHNPRRLNNKGINIMLAEPNIWHMDSIFIPANTSATVEIDPTKLFHDKDTRATPTSVRKCIFADERNSHEFKTLPGFDYRFENCEAQCHQEYLLRHCNCTMDLLFPPGPFPSCKAAALLCLAKNNERFLYTQQSGEQQYVRNHFEGMSCNCMHNCHTLQYLMNVQVSPLTLAMRGNASYTDLSFHYRFDTLVSYRTRLIYTWLDLLVAFGGIAGLFLGCSLISAVEVLHFVLIEIPRQLWLAHGEMRAEKRRAVQRQQQRDHFLQCLK